MRNKYLGFICLLYSGIIGYVWYTKKLSNFLAPQLQMYIKIALVPLLIIGIVFIFSKKSDSFRFTDIILLLPLVLLILAGDGRISMTMANNRMGNFGQKKNNVTYVGPVEVEEVDEDITYNFEHPYFKVIDASYDDLSSYLTFMPNAIDYVGKTIKVKGFSVKYGNIVPDGYFALGKYVISCCAADAEFGGFIVKTGDHNIMHNKWYEIEGVLQQMPLNDYGYVLYIKIINIKEIDETSEEQYVYPCYAYDNGICGETKKYNLNYD